MAQARVRFYEELNDSQPPKQRKVEFTHTFDGRASVRDMIEALDVPRPEIERLTLNSGSVGFDYIVREGDRITD